MAIDYAWRDLQVFLNGKELVRITGFEVNPEQDVEDIYGAGDEVLDLEPGNRRYPGMITLKLAEVNIMNASARAAGGRDLMDIRWEIVESYRAKDNLPRVTNTYSPVIISGYKSGMEQNAPGGQIQLPFKTLRPKTK